MNSELLTVTNLVVAITCVISYFAMQNHELKAKLLFHPVTISKQNQWYRFLSSGFIHADNWHLIINMFVLWSFGTAIENRYYPQHLGEFSTVKYLILYFGGIVAASIPSFIRHKNDARYSALGASGGVAAVVFAVIMFAPWQNLYLYGVLPIPQILAGVAYLVYSWVKDKKANDNIGHMAHLTGAIWGFVFTGLMSFALFGRFIGLTLQGPSWM